MTTEQFYQQIIESLSERLDYLIVTNEVEGNNILKVHTAEERTIATTEPEQQAILEQMTEDLAEVLIKDNCG